MDTQRELGGLCLIPGQWSPMVVLNLSMHPHPSAGTEEPPLNRLDCERCCQTAIPNRNICQSITIDPTDLPTSVDTLQRKKPAQVHLVPDSYKIAYQDTHSECECITLGTYPLLHSVFRRGCNIPWSSMSSEQARRRVIRKKKAFGSVEVLGTLQVRSMQKDISDPEVGSVGPRFRVREYKTA
jgi:hypothetical protein